MCGRIAIFKKNNDENAHKYVVRRKKIEKERARDRETEREKERETPWETRKGGQKILQEIMTYYISIHIMTKLNN